MAVALHTTPLEFRFAALRQLQAPRVVRRLAVWLAVSLVSTVVGMLFVPWQQNSQGTGRIVAYHPTERPQTIEAPIYGRVVRWGEGIVEGAVVKEGQMILEMRDNDPGRADRLTTQVLAISEKLLLSQTKAETYGRQVVDLSEARQQVIEANQQLIEEARRKVEAEKHGVEAADAAVLQTLANFERQKSLYEKGLTSGVSFEKDRRSYEEATAKQKAAQQYVEGAQNYLKSKQAELEQKSREAQTKIDYARAMQQEALGEVALARKELAEMEGKRAQFDSRVVVAPRDGVILRLMANDNAEMLKEGDPLFTIVPATAERAVEMWVDGNDLPLVTVDREVRLQFEGWPAVQFAAGWPEAAYGTFGGRVAAVDATDNGKGKFRVLVRPDPEDSPWPDQRFLRQGVRANGWILLDRVTLGYEIWRQLNGFPAVFDDAAAKAGSKGGYAKDGQDGQDGGDDKEAKQGKVKVKAKLPK
ncbi:MAG TPA: HlyD family efflux transporter periplasmic adaptor subunit [Pirellulaceae bacterium]|nr:HlyD family efflux transporter periplasmic adaptor subunit [Pirellulaceae bacterium]